MKTPEFKRRTKEWFKNRVGKIVAFEVDEIHHPVLIKSTKHAEGIFQFQCDNKRLKFSEL